MILKGVHLIAKCNTKVQSVPAKWGVVGVCGHAPPPPRESFDFRPSEIAFRVNMPSKLEN